MNIVYLLIPLGVALTVIAGAALIWAVNSGQFEDLEEAGRAVLEPDTAAEPQQGAAPVTARAARPRDP